MMEGKGGQDRKRGDDRRRLRIGHKNIVVHAVPFPAANPAA